MRPLDLVESRVLGVLVEKHMTTPNVYPLTLAAIVAGSNQATNREPVMTIDEEQAEAALVRLHDLGVATPVRRQGDRATKYRHKMGEFWEIGVAEQAVLAVLLLRGPQTVGELRQRTDRYVSFASTADVDAVVDRLAEHELARRLRREPGQSQPRVVELVGETDGSTPSLSVPASSDSSEVDPAALSVVERVDELERRFNELLRRLGEEDL